MGKPGWDPCSGPVPDLGHLLCTLLARPRSQPPHLCPHVPARCHVGTSRGTRAKHEAMLGAIPALARFGTGSRAPHPTTLSRDSEPRANAGGPQTRSGTMPPSPSWPKPAAPRETLTSPSRLPAPGHSEPPTALPTRNPPGQGGITAQTGCAAGQSSLPSTMGSRGARRGPGRAGGGRWIG